MLNARDSMFLSEYHRSSSILITIQRLRLYGPRMSRTVLCFDRAFDRSNQGMISQWLTPLIVPHHLTLLYYDSLQIESWRRIQIILWVIPLVLLAILEDRK